MQSDPLWYAAADLPYLNSIEALTIVKLNGLDETITVISRFRCFEGSLDYLEWAERSFPPTSIASYQQRNPFAIKLLNLGLPLSSTLMDWLGDSVPNVPQSSMLLHHGEWARDFIISAGAFKRQKCSLPRRPHVWAIVRSFSFLILIPPSPLILSVRYCQSLISQRAPTFNRCAFV